MPDFTDREIIQKAIAGDKQAFRRLVEQHQSFVFALSYRFVHDRADAEDLTQEAFVRLWKNLSKYRTDMKLTTWLYKIVTNLCLDYLKSSYETKRRQAGQLEQAHGIASGFSADQHLIDDDARRAVAIMAMGLTPKQKSVFVLRDIEELSLPEIGEILSMSAGRVKSNLYYARRKMSEWITRYYAEKRNYPGI